jgi:hypothetical protein
MTTRGQSARAPKNTRSLARKVFPNQRDAQGNEIPGEDQRLRPMRARWVLARRHVDRGTWIHPIATQPAPMPADGLRTLPPGPPLQIPEPLLLRIVHSRKKA